ncbi:Aste57867_18133 [Aphanomyces stellatus]|uniref:Aste57867_18133 protein n=1 Tax=Aphanomyces stellatus TaxID=120398 RepID=A0A485L9M2_9STRA|nr:hypothetical protein As57867_018071 [Aphanomyces stellatus]VFT94871.1 Aste57867_18133 [Aphanomyces stellatus]
MGEMDGTSAASSPTSSSSNVTSGKINFRDRNEYQRKAQQRYRKERSVHRKQLRQLVVDLEARVSHLQEEAGAGGGSSSMRQKHRKGSGGMLPWTDVALALQDAVELSQTENADLRVQVKDAKRVAYLLMTYVGDLMVARTCLRTKMETWQHVSLLADPTARRHGFDWITTQLFHGAPRVFAENAFPASTHEVFFGVDVAPDQYQVVIRHQRLVPHCVGDLTAAYRRFFLESNGFGYAIEDLADDDETSSTTTAPSLHAMDMVYRRRNIGNPEIGDVMQNYVHRQFVDDDGRRSVLVARNIVSDDKHPLGAYKRDASGWIEVQAMDAQTSLVRECWTVCPLLRGDAFASWADEASFYGLQLDLFATAELQFAALQQAVFRQGQSVLAKRNAFFDTLR